MRDEGDVLAEEDATASGQKLKSRAGSAVWLVVVPEPEALAEAPSGEPALWDAVGILLPHLTVTESDVMVAEQGAP